MDAKSILLVTLALLTAAYSPLNIYGEKLQDARRWYARGREAMAKCHPQRGAGDAQNCLAADPTVAKLVSFIARPVADASESTSFSTSERRNLIGFGFGLDF